MARESAEKIVYASCASSGCAVPGGCCLLKVRVKDGAIRAIEPGDPINRGMPREDVPEDALLKQMIQNRPCTRAYSWRRSIDHEDRLQYPMKRVGERGEHKFERISWDEALGTIANKIVAMGEKYGPHSILGELPILQWAGPQGFVTWGYDSFGGYFIPDMFTLGYAQGAATRHDFEVSEETDVFNSKLILWFGANPAVAEKGSMYWLIKAKEKGIPIIFVDPVYTVSAETYADQWIPIRPNTDLAMLLAMANVLFKEELYDMEYVAKFVEPAGFQKWKDYVQGQAAGPDGQIDRTPEWAEAICGVPSETIKQLARLYGRTKPCNMRLNKSATRQLYGENAGRVAIYLQAMTGNLGVPGGSAGSEVNLGYSMIFQGPSIDWKMAPPPYPAERLMYKRAWMDAILLRDKLLAGEITEDEYRRRCGIAADWPLVNLHMVWISSGVNQKYTRMTPHRSGRPTLGNQELNRVFAALKKLDFIVGAAYAKTAYPTLFADIVLPLADPYFEDYRGFLYGWQTTSNHFICGFKAVEPPGEARPLEWIMVQLAKRLGVGEQYSPRLVDVVDDYPKGYDRRIEDLLKEGYETWAARDDIKPMRPPAWDEFRKLPMFRIPYEGRPHVAFADKTEKGQPFDTPSGKIEFYSSFLADPEMGRKSYVTPREKVETRMCFGGSVPPTIPPMGQWMLPWNAMLAREASQYPLAMLSSHCYHRQHTSQDNNPWVRDELRHSVHMSIADAKQRDIKDGDTVRVFNDQGEILMPAYVTGRMTPGSVIIPHGAWPELSAKKTTLMPDGIDTRGADNFLTSSVHYPWVVGVGRSTDLVQVEKYQG